MRTTAIVRDDLRYRPGLREQRVQHADRGLVVAGLAADRDRVQPGAVPAQPRRVPRHGRVPVEAVAIAERLDVRDVAEAVPVRGTAGVDQLRARLERFQEVSTKTALTPVRPLP